MLIVHFGGTSAAQTIPVSDQLMQEYVRIKQLEGKIDSNISLNVKPLGWEILGNDSNSEYQYIPKDLTPVSRVVKLKIFPVTSIQQFNSHHAYGWNDGLMIPAKGYQQYFSAGLYVKMGPLTIQAKPEYVYASNPQYLSGNDKIAASRYTSFISTGDPYGADLPEYYGKPNYNVLELGQSSIRLNLGPASLGVSNENLWWGPGRRNSLLMSNSARGFKHITLNTVKPVVTGIGSFEGQIISGKLENSNSIENLNKVQEWRYLSGMILDYQPKWIPGLFLGITRVFQMYNTDVDGFADYFPLFQPFEKKRTQEDNKKRDQLTSVFARFVLKEANAEIYAELARNDHSFNLRDFAQEPQHSRAYLIGIQKIVTLPAPDQKLLIAGEITQLSQPINRLVRSAGTWYVHNINQGYTNQGEVLGAGTGPGGNLQTLEFSWLSGFKKIGLQIERYEHNRDFYEIALDSGDSYNEQWVDLSVGLLTNWSYKNFLIKGQFSGIQSLNYLWQTGNNSLPQKNVFNFQAGLGLHYYIK